MTLALKSLIFTYALLIAALMLATGYAFSSRIGLVKGGIFLAVGIAFLATASTIFLVNDRPGLWRAPLFAFLIYGLFEIAFTGSGMLSEGANRITPLHWFILVMLRVVIPLLLAWASFRQWRLSRV